MRGRCDGTGACRRSISVAMSGVNMNVGKRENELCSQRKERKPYKPSISPEKAASRSPTTLSG